MFVSRANFWQLTDVIFGSYVSAFIRHPCCLVAWSDFWEVFPSYTYQSFLHNLREEPDRAISLHQARRGGQERKKERERKSRKSQTNWLSQKNDLRWEFQQKKSDQATRQHGNKGDK